MLFSTIKLLNLSYPSRKENRQGWSVEYVDYLVYALSCFHEKAAKN